MSEDAADTCQAESQNDVIPTSPDSSKNGEKQGTENGQTLNKDRLLETSKEKLHEILNRELSIFCKKMCSARTGDVSKEQETNQRHEVAEGYEEDAKPEDDVETKSKGSGDCASSINHKVHSSDDTFVEEIDNLKRKLTDDLNTLLSSNEGKIFNFRFEQFCFHR